MTQGRPEVPSWVSSTTTGTPLSLNDSNVREAFGWVLKILDRTSLTQRIFRSPRAQPSGSKPGSLLSVPVGSWPSAAPGPQPCSWPHWRRSGAAGLAAPTEWPLTRDVIIADTNQAARELAERHIMVAYRKEYAGGWKHPFIDSSIATDLDSLMKDRFLIGGPDEVIRAVRPFVEQYGMTHLICRLFFPGMPHRHILRELELLSREVMPAFR